MYTRRVALDRRCASVWRCSDCVAPGHQLGFNDLKTIEVADFLEAIAGGEFDIFYDLVSDAPDAVFTITLKASDDGGKTFGLRPSAITGDVANVKPGLRKKIVWRSGQDVAILAYDLLKFDAVATLVPAPPTPSPWNAPTTRK